MVLKRMCIYKHLGLSLYSIHFLFSAYFKKIISFIPLIKYSMYKHFLHNDFLRPDHEDKFYIEGMSYGKYTLEISIDRH